ncbi:ECF transporter S component [Alicyclobacillus fastidiosus]|uniref:ECF transporter S component n=1 Tax=Alicyclobacillus fastidiosus TaxID=392011 RepID=A0ABY6ZFY8_9BACL|nr:ECF transporter S component [Alicyclobacillus fastidiosus]WAH41757.1 ECF transporter S component [Alicyclobacillus fastidiosus]GMA63449.1 putative HMP/thiamine permease protein YkoE [Alicyclobacillus fastidiosus]
MWKLREIVAMVILSVVCGGIYRIWDVVSPLISIAWVPGQGVINGLWWLAAGLIPYIVRRPGAALISELVAAIIELGLGGNWGLGGLLSGLIQGIGAEIAFMIFGWRKYHWSVLMLSGALAGIAFSVQWYFQYGGHTYTASIVVLYTIITMISGAVLGGLLPKWIGDALKRTGVLRNFEIAKRSA